MLPWSPFQEKILSHHVIDDPETGLRLPVVEAAIVSKYAAIISPYRSFIRKEQDAVDFRRLIKTNHQNLRRDILRDLAGDVWEGGADEIERYVAAALQDQRFE